MNENICVGVCCYAGDANQVVSNIESYAHHQTHVIILSPEDSPVKFPGWDCRQAGKRAYIGQDSLDRQKRYLEILLTLPHQYFLLNDSDSMCLSPEIPIYVQDRPNVIYSNEVTEPRPHASPYPKIAMQPPYLFSRQAAEKLLTVADRIKAHEITPYVDWWMLACSCESGLEHRDFSKHEVGNPVIHKDTMGAAWGEPWEALSNRVRINGRIFVHPVKSKDHLDRLFAHHREFRRTHP